MGTYHTEEGLTGIIAFTKWCIPQKTAFYNYKDLTFILWMCPILGVDMTGMFHRASNFNQPLNIGHIHKINVKSL